MSRSLLSQSISRRRWLLGMSALVVPAIIAACAPAAAPTNTTVPVKPAEAPKPAATTAPSAATTAPAAPAATTAPAATSAPAVAPTTAASAPAAKPAVADATRPAPAAAAPAATGQKTKLLFWKHNYDAADNLVKTLIGEFQTQNSTIEVQFEVQPNAGYEPKILTGLAGDVGLDMWDLSDPQASSFIAKGLVAPLKPDVFGFASQADMEKQWLPNTLNMFKGKDGKLYSVHFEFNAWSIFVNKLHYKEAGLDPVANAPKTFDDLAANAAKLTKKEGDRIVRAGFEWGDSLGPNWTMLGFGPILYQMGGSFLTDDDKGNKSAINSAEGVKALKLYTSPVREWKSTVNGFGVKTPAKANDNFTKGLSSQWMSGPWAPPDFKANPEVYGNYKVVPFPQAADAKRRVVSSSGWGWFANPKSAKQDAVWKWTDFASKQGPRWLKDAGYILPRIGWFDSPEAKGYQDLDVFLKDMEVARPRLQHPNYPEVQAAVGRLVDRVLADGMDPQKSLELAAVDIDKAVGG